MWPILLSLHSKKRDCFSPCNPGDPQTTLSTLWSPPSFPIGALSSQPGMTLAMAQTSKTSDFSLCCLQQLVVVSRFPFPGQFWRSVFLVQSPAYASLSLSLSVCLFLLSLTLIPLYDQGSLSFATPAVLFSPKSTLCSSYLPRCGHFSTASCAVLLYHSSD